MIQNIYVLKFLNIVLVNHLVKRVMGAPETCEPFIDITRYNDTISNKPVLGNQQKEISKLTGKLIRKLTRTDIDVSNTACHHYHFF